MPPLIWIHNIQSTCVVQAVVAERVSVRLEPVDLRIAPPSAQEFHDSLQRLFTEGGIPACAHAVLHGYWRSSSSFGLASAGTGKLQRC
jgi:hypothetical protein